MKAGLRRTILWSAIGFIVIAGLVWSFRPQPVPVEIATVIRGPMRVDTTEEGRTRVQERYEVSAPVSGTLVRIEGKAGDMVQGNKTVVATLLPTAPGFLDVRTRAQAEYAVKSAEAARDLAAADVRRIQAELNFAASDLRRANALWAKQAIAFASVDRARLVFNTQTAALASARAALQAKQYDLETAKAQLIDPVAAAQIKQDRPAIPIVAPVSGRILRTLRDSEAVVTAGTPILEIGNSNDLEIVVELLSEEAVKVKPHARATLTDWGGQAVLNARVRRVDPSGFTKVSALGVEEQRVNAILDFTDPPSKWASIADGFRVIAHIVVWQGENIVQVPISAMFRTGSGWSAFLVRDNRAALVPVRIGHSNEDMSEVLGGLRPGDRVIAHPSDRVRDGSRVSPEAG